MCFARRHLRKTGQKWEWLRPVAGIDTSLETSLQYALGFPSHMARDLLSAQAYGMCLMVHMPGLILENLT